MTRRLLLALGALLLGVSGLAGVEFSSAEFSDTSQTPVLVTAAPDWTPPTVAVVDPGYAVSGTVLVAATASDAVSDLVSVEIQYQPSGGAWTSLCADTAAPWSCPWDTTVLPDGPYGLRAVAVDAEGNTETSAVVDTEVVNTAAVVIDPVPSPVRGTITLTASLVNVPINSWATITFQASVAGANDWNDLPGCSGPGPEASCLFDTTAGSGTFDLRAVGRLPGNTWFYDVQTGVVVDNDLPEVGLTVPASPLAGTVGLTVTASDALSGLAGVLVEYRLQGGGWLGCGAGTGSPYTCEVDTAALADGSYDFRATATDAAGNSRTTDPVTRVVDNHAPTVSLTVPPGPLSGTVSLVAAASDGGGVVASVLVRYRLVGAVGWSTCGSGTAAPYTCSLDTTALPNGGYELQATATDAAGRTAGSGIETRTVSNAVGSVSISTPAASSTVFGTTTVSASASSTGGVTSVALQYRAPAGDWTTICTASSAPYQCPWNTASLPYGGYQLRAVMTHAGSQVLTSAPVAVVVPQPSGHDVQGVGATNNTPGNGDQIRLTFTDAMNLSSIAGGLSGSTPVSTTVSLVGGGTDSLTFAAGVNLGQVVFAQDYVSTGRTVTFAATLTAGTATVNGISVTTVTVTLGSRTGGNANWLASDSSTGAMTWTPASGALDLGGNACSVAPVTETGAADKDL